MLRKLFRKSKAAEVSGVQKEMCSLPIWARDNEWEPLAKEFAKYASLWKKIGVIKSQIIL